MSDPSIEVRLTDIPPEGSEGRVVARDESGAVVAHVAAEDTGPASARVTVALTMIGGGDGEVVTGTPHAE